MTRAANWNTEVFDASVTFAKDDGSPGKVQGIPAWSSDNPDVIINATADGMSAVISATANAGAVISVDADGDLGTAVLKLHTEGSVVFSDTDVEATQIGLVIGDPRVKDAAAPESLSLTKRKKG